MTTAQEEKRDKVMRHVRAMIAKADSTPEQGEADVFRAKAEELMLKYMISEHELASSEGDSRTPNSVDMDFEWYWASPWSGQLWMMYLDLARHCNVRVVHWSPSSSTIPVVGTESNRAYFDMLFTSVMMEFSKGLEPRPDPSKPMIENLATLKESGQQWLRIAEQLRSIGQLRASQFSTREEIADDLTAKGFFAYGEKITSVQKKQVHHLNFSGQYTKFCNETGRPRLRTTPKIFQRSYALGFVDEIHRRLREMRERAMRNMTAQESSGLALVLADDRTRAEHKAVELYGNPPQRRGGGVRGRDLKFDSAAMDVGRQRASQVSLSNPSGGLRSQKEIKP